MTWPFENDTSAITKKIAKNDIDKNRVKKVFSLTTIVFATALLMMLVMFESGYETTKDRMAEGQPQVVFYDLSQQQIELLYSEENIESIKVTETENGYDASITIVDATKMTQYGFSSAVDNISSKYDIHHVTRNDLFMDTWIITVTAILVLAVVACFMTNPRQPKESTAQGSNYIDLNQPPTLDVIQNGQTISDRSSSEDRQREVELESALLGEAIKKQESLTQIQTTDFYR